MPLYSDTVKTAMLLKHLAGVDYTTPSVWRIALVQVPPDDNSGNGLVEPSDASYARLAVDANSDEFAKADEGPEVINRNDWSWTALNDEEWGSIVGIALFTGAGAYQGYYPFSSPKYMGANYTFTLPAGSVAFSMKNTALSVYVEESSVPIIRTAPNGNRYAISVNNSGSVVTTALANIWGPPTPPQTVAYNPTTREITWTAPAYTGGSPVISFTVWLSDGGTLTQEFFLIGNGVYVFTVPEDYAGAAYVTAENLVGSSDPSTLVSVT